MKLFLSTKFFRKFNLKNRCENEFDNNSENYAANPKIGFITKSNFESILTHESPPTTWELYRETPQGKTEDSQYSFFVFI